MKRIRNLKEKNIDFEDRKLALAQFLKLGVEELDEIEEGYDETQLTYGREEYLVVVEDEADKAFMEYQQNLWDDLGIESFSEHFRDYIMNNMVDEKSFWRDMESDIYDWIADEPTSYSNYFDIDDVKKEILKQANKGKIDAGDLEYGLDEDDYEDKKEFQKAIEDAIDNLDDEEALKILNDAGYLDASDATEAYIKDQGSPYDFLENMYGRDSEAITKALEPYLDEKKIFEEVQDQDGRAPSLAGYDGEENEEKVNGTWFFIYRTN